MLHQLINGDICVIDDSANGITDLLQIMRSHIGGHSDSNPATTVCQHEGEGSRQDCGFLKRLVIVRAEVDCLLLDIDKHLFTDPAHLHFSVTHRSRWVSVDGSEVTLWGDHRIPE